MITNGVSHIALGVRNIDISLAFYRDMLGFSVVRDELQSTQGTVLPALYKEEHAERRVATLYWDTRPGAAFLVLSEHSDKPVEGEAIRLDQIGIHHYALWVKDLPEVYQELKAKGVQFVVAPTVTKTPEGNFHSAFLRDPDGILVQLDELVTD